LERELLAKTENSLNILVLMAQRRRLLKAISSTLQIEKIWVSEDAASIVLHKNPTFMLN